MTPRREPAWSYLLLNILVLPGAGSYMGGRRVAGVLQAVLSLAGFVLTTVWLWSWVAVFLRDATLPEGLGPKAGWGLLGIVLFLVSWSWALVSGLALLREARAGSAPG